MTSSDEPSGGPISQLRALILSVLKIEPEEPGMPTPWQRHYACVNLPTMFRKYSETNSGCVFCLHQLVPRGRFGVRGGAQPGRRVGR